MERRFCARGVTRDRLACTRSPFQGASDAYCEPDPVGPPGARPGRSAGRAQTSAPHPLWPGAEACARLGTRDRLACTWRPFQGASDAYYCTQQSCHRLFAKHDSMGMFTEYANQTSHRLTFLLYATRIKTASHQDSQQHLFFQSLAWQFH